MQQQTTLWTRDFLIDSSVNLFLYLTYYLLILTITVFASEAFEATPSQAGLASGLFILGALVARLFAGRSIEGLGCKRMLYLGVGLLIGTTGLYFAVGNLQALYAVRFFNGLAFGICSTATGTIAAHLIPKERRGEGMSYYAMSGTIASAIGPFLGMVLCSYSTMDMIFLLCTVLSLCCLGGVLFLRVPPLQLTAEQRRQAASWRPDSFFESKALPIAFLSLLMGFCYSSVLGFLTSYTKEIGLLGAGSFFFIVYAAVVFLSRPLTGRLFDQKGENMVMYPAFAFFALGMLLLSQVQAEGMLLLGGACIGLGFGTFFSCAQALAVKVSPKHRMGLATSTFYILLDGGIGIGPFLLGMLVPSLGFRGLYAVMAALVLACGILYRLLHGAKAGREEEELAA